MENQWTTTSYFVTWSTIHRHLSRFLFDVDLKSQNVTQYELALLQPMHQVCNQRVNVTLLIKLHYFSKRLEPIRLYQDTIVSLCELARMLVNMLTSVIIRLYEPKLRNIIYLHACIKSMTTF